VLKLSRLALKDATISRGGKGWCSIIIGLRSLSRSLISHSIGLYGAKNDLLSLKAYKDQSFDARWQLKYDSVSHDKQSIVPALQHRKHDNY